MWRRWSTVPVAAALAAAVAVPSHALSNIRFERWGFFSTSIQQDTTAPIDSTTEVTVTFDATSTSADTDPSAGLRFSIAERDAGANQILVRFATHPCTSLPPPGSDVVVTAQFRLYCDRAGNLHAREGVAWGVDWCENPVAQACGSRGPLPSAGLPAVSEPERFELVVLDENDAEGSFPTPEDVLLGPGDGPGEIDAEFVAPHFAASGSLGIYTDPGGTLCSAFIQPLVPFRWYIVAHLAGLNRCGITLMEFGIHTLPPQMFVNVIPNPAALMDFGSPWTTAGIGFDCERGTGTELVLYTLEGVATEPVSDVVLQTEGGDWPSNRHWTYPWSSTCPMYGEARRRVVGTKFIVNPSPGNRCETTIRVEPASWSHLKELYR